MSVCGESNRAIEVSLNRARRVEVIMADEESKDKLTERMEASFRMAYKEGKFQVELCPRYLGVSHCTYTS